MWLISINVHLSNRKFLIFSFQFFTFSFVHFCFLSVSEARSFLLYSKYKGRKILAIEFKHLHSKLFQINLFDFSFKCSSENIWIPSCPATFVNFFSCPPVFDYVLSRAGMLFWDEVAIHSLCFISNTVKKGLVSHFQDSIVVA